MGDAGPSAFTRLELAQMLSVYTRRVVDGEWRDYAIDTLDGMAVFSIYRRTQERPLFAIVKQASGADAPYALFAGPAQLECGSLTDLLAALESRPRLIQG